MIACGLENSPSVDYSKRMETQDEYIQDQALAEKINQLVGEIAPEQDAWVCGLTEVIDEDGEASWIVNLCYELSETPIKPSHNAKLVFEIREFLSSRGDTRFPYIYHNLPEGQPVATAC